jgi:hypothetical protein
MRSALLGGLCNVSLLKVTLLDSLLCLAAYPSIVGARISLRNSVESIFFGIVTGGCGSCVSSDSFFRIERRFLRSGVSFDSLLEWSSLGVLSRFLSWCIFEPSERDRVSVSISIAVCPVSGMSKLKLRVFITVSSSSSFCLSFKIFSFLTKGRPPYSGDKSSIDLQHTEDKHRNGVLLADDINLYCFVLAVITSLGLGFWCTWSLTLTVVTLSLEGGALVDGSEESREIAAFFNLLQGGSFLSDSLTLSLALMDGSLTSADDASFGMLECNFSLSLRLATM